MKLLKILKAVLPVLLPAALLVSGRSTILATEDGDWRNRNQEV